MRRNSVLAVKQFFDEIANLHELAFNGFLAIQPNRPTKGRTKTRTAVSECRAALGVLPGLHEHNISAIF